MEHLHTVCLKATLTLASALQVQIPSSSLRREGADHRQPRGEFPHQDSAAPDPPPRNRRQVQQSAWAERVGMLMKSSNGVLLVALSCFVLAIHLPLKFLCGNIAKRRQK